MEFVGNTFQLISVLLGLLAIAILFWVNKDQTHSNRMLGILLLALSILNVNGVLFHSGLYLTFFWLHKVALPFALLVGPAAYVYTRSVVRSEFTFAKTDWLLLLPFILIAINYLPYYTMPASEKKAYLVMYYNNSTLRSSDGEGFLPAYVVAFFRALWSVSFIVLNFRLMYQFKKQATAKVLANNAAALQWLNQLNSMLLALMLTALFAAIIAPIKKTIFNLLDVGLGSFVFVICLNLFIRPKILYGLHQPVTNRNDERAGKLDTEVLKEASDENVIQSIISADALRYKQQVETYFNEHKPFLNPNYSLEQFVIDTNIPRNILSAFINKEYGMGFREFLNRYRVDYLLKNLEKPEWKQYTMEAIAIECGFASRVTFFKNFKQITGLSPTGYIKNRNRKK